MGIEWVLDRAIIVTVVSVIVAGVVFITGPANFVEKVVRLWWDIQGRRERELGKLPKIEVERPRLIDHTDLVSTRSEPYSRERVLPHVLVKPDHVFLKIQVFDGDRWKVTRVEVVQAKRNNIQHTPTKDVFAGKKGGGPPWLPALWFPEPLHQGIACFLPCYPNPDAGEIEVRFHCERNRSRRWFGKGITRQRAWTEPIRVKDATIYR